MGGCLSTLYLVVLTGLVIVGLVYFLSDYWFEDEFSITGVGLSVVAISLYVFLLFYTPHSKAMVYYHDSEGFFLKGSKVKNLYVNTSIELIVNEKYKEKNLSFFKKYSTEAIKFVRLKVKEKDGYKYQFLDTGEFKLKPLLKLLFEHVPEKNIRITTFKSYHRNDAERVSIHYSDGEKEYI